MKARRLTGGALFLTSLLVAGCNAVPMTYSQWKTEQDQRAKFAEAGIPYKTLGELRGEAAEMSRVAQETTFKPSR